MLTEILAFLKEFEKYINHVVISIFATRDECVIKLNGVQLIEL